MLQKITTMSKENWDYIRHSLNCQGGMLLNSEKGEYWDPSKIKVVPFPEGTSNPFSTAQSIETKYIYENLTMNIFLKPQLQDRGMSNKNGLIRISYIPAKNSIKENMDESLIWAGCSNSFENSIYVPTMDKIRESVQSSIEKNLESQYFTKNTIEDITRIITNHITPDIFTSHSI